MVRLLVLMLCTLSAFCSVSSAFAGSLEPTVERQDIVVTLIPSDHLLIGKSTITFAAGTRNASFKLSPTAKIESVTISTEKIPFSFAEGALSLDIPTTAGQGAVLVTVAYRAVFNDSLPLHPSSTEDPTYGVNGTITTKGTFLGYGAGWYPAPSSTPRSRSVRISAPAGTEAVTAGKRVSRETAGDVSHSYWEELRPIGGLSLCAGPYRIEERRVAGVDLYTYFYQGNASLASRYLDAAARYLSLYSDLFGPYPFEKFAVVENFFPTGYGFPSFTLLGSSIIRLPFIIDTSFPHEIAHSWWGNAIQVDQSEGNWSEGLVTYLADYLLKEKRSPAEGRDYRIQFLTEYTTLATDNDLTLSAFSSRVDPASRVIGYGKGAMVFHMIRTEIGDHAFFGALREICRERLYRSATWSDLERAFSRSSGKDLSSFMKQWLTRPGGPRLALSKVTQLRKEKGWVVSGTIEQSSPFYELQLPLRLETDGAPVKELLQVSQGLTQFSIFSASEPRHLLLDPDAEKFRLLSPGEMPVTVNSIKGSKQFIAVMTEDCRAGKETFQRLLESLGKGKTAAIKEDEPDTESIIQGKDLMFCGIPKKRSLLPALPAWITIRDTDFFLNKDVVSAPDGMLFVVLPLPTSSGRVAALFKPLSEEAAKQYAPKITHYGKYGSLVFNNGAIRHKGTTQPSAKESNVSF